MFRFGSHALKQTNEIKLFKHVLLASIPESCWGLFRKTFLFPFNQNIYRISTICEKMDGSNLAVNMNPLFTDK